MRRTCYNSGDADRLIERARISSKHVPRPVATEENIRQDEDEITSGLDADPRSTAEPADRSDDLTRSFFRLSNLPTYPLDRLSRYEATLWRQACQILFTLRCLDQRKPWERRRLR
jgi:hypothetical protein